MLKLSQKAQAIKDVLFNEEQEPCEICKGKGYKKTSAIMTEGSAESTIMTCPNCGGTGVKPEPKCSAKEMHREIAKYNQSVKDDPRSQQAEAMEGR